VKGVRRRNDGVSSSSILLLKSVTPFWRGAGMEVVNVYVCGVVYVCNLDTTRILIVAGCPLQHLRVYVVWAMSGVVGLLCMCVYGWEKGRMWRWRWR
jgi:hypothetical protein